MLSLRRLVRLAGRLGEARQTRSRCSDRDVLWRILDAVWNSLHLARRRLDLADERGFRLSRPALLQDLHLQIDALTRAVAALKEYPAEPVPSTADWVGELRALEAEFGEVEVDDRLGVLRVTTEPITLKEVELGAFALELVWSRFGQTRGSACFDIVAREANPAAGRDRVTHPHVQDGSLCAGDATAPIDRAIAAGRLSDAFVLVRSVLTNYNPRSAYVDLDEWDGTPCSECGDRVDRGDFYYCAGCHSDLCEPCASCCRSCEETRCGGCLEPCAVCSDPTCDRCLDEIDGQSVCAECRDNCRQCNDTVLRSALNPAGLCTGCAEPEIPVPEEVPCPAIPINPG